MLWQILHQLKSKDAAIRRKAVEQLYHKPNERAFRVLASLLRDSDQEVRRMVVMALGKLENEQRAEPLLEALKDRDAGVLQAAAAALKNAPAGLPISALQPLLRHSDAGVRGQAAQTLQTLGWRPGGLDEEIWYRVAKGQFFQAAGFGVAAVPALEAALASGSPSIGAGAIEALGHIGDRSVLRP